MCYRWRSHCEILFTSKTELARKSYLCVSLHYCVRYSFRFNFRKKRCFWSKHFRSWFLYTAYADGTTFFVKDLNSAKEVLINLTLYSNVSGLYPNLEKCQIPGIGHLKNVNVALCGIKSVNLMEYFIKILSDHISYNKKLPHEF